MAKRWPVVVCALLVGTALAVTGCAGRQDEESSGGAVAAAVLRVPMMAVIREQEELVKRLEAGNVTGARYSYMLLSEAFGQVLAQVNRTEPGLAQEMLAANVALQDLLTQKEPDRAQVRKQAQSLVTALRRAADGVGISLTGTAAGQVGNGAPAATPAAKARAPEATPAAKTRAPAATPAAKAGATAADTGPVAGVKEQTVEVRAREYRFTPATITVAKGTRVTIKLINEGTDRHEFELDAFRFEIRPIAPRTSAQASFVADRVGKFEFACHVDDHYEKGMKGTLVVK